MRLGGTIEREPVITSVYEPRQKRRRKRPWNWRLALRNLAIAVATGLVVGLLATMGVMWIDGG